MKILRNYILRETILPFILSLATLTFVMLMGNLIRLTELVINKGVNIFLVLKIFIYLVPFLLSYTLPIACLTTVLLTFSRLSSDNEILAIRANGISLVKIIMPPIIMGIILSLVSVVLNDKIIPYSHFASRKVLVDIGSKNPAAVLEAGTFITAFQDHIMFIYHIDGNKLNNIRIYQPQGKDRPTRTIIAKKGEFISLPKENKIKLKLMDGTSDEPDLKNPNNFYKLNFKTYFMNLNLSSSETNIGKKPKDMTIKELESEIQKLKPMSIDTAPLLTEIHKKISLSFASLIFILFGLPLAIITHRRERLANFSLLFLVVAIYYLLTIGFESLSMQNVISPLLAMWITNAIFGLIGLIFIYRLCVY